MTGFSGFDMSNPVIVPDIEQIEKWDRQRELAIESLEISGNFVMCQRCKLPQRMHKEPVRPIND